MWGACNGGLRNHRANDVQRIACGGPTQTRVNRDGRKDACRFSRRVWGWLPPPAPDPSICDSATIAKEEKHVGTTIDQEFDTRMGLDAQPAAASQLSAMRRSWSARARAVSHARSLGTAPSVVRMADPVGVPRGRGG